MYSKGLTINYYAKRKRLSFGGLRRKKENGG